jgi:hypothetical protein
VINLSIYNPLRRFLETRNKPRISLSFRELERILGFKLPHSAYAHRAWWANDHTHTHARNGWLAAGYMVDYVSLDEKTVVFVKANQYDSRTENRSSTSTMPRGSSSLSRAVRSGREFEMLARRVMSRYFGVELRNRRRPGWPKEFDLVSPDYRIVGDAKYYSMVRGKYQPPAKFATIGEHVWMLENIDADIRFLVSGNDKRVPLRWLEKYGNMVRTVSFYFITSDERVEKLK